MAGRDLGNRISDLALEDAGGKAIPFRQIGVGEFLAERDIEGWKYTVDLKAPVDRQLAAHVSWLADEVGFLMLNDLLPAFGPQSVEAWILVLPNGLKVSGVPKLDHPMAGENVRDGKIRHWYVARESDKAVLMVGGGGRNQRVTPSLELTLSGSWHFRDNEAAEMSREVYQEYKKLFGEYPDAASSIAIANFPLATRPGEWQAETRGNSVTIISSDMPFRSQSLQRLHEQLRHELFHLWIPNGLNLKGNYDWFYEGFALYQSLKLAVGVNRIRFEDFLDTLSRAHTIDSAIGSKVSLIDASANRFAGANTQIYARGMLVAFQIDLALLERSGGKRSVENLLREFYGKHRTGTGPAEANAAVLTALRANRELVPIVDRYVTGAEPIDWSNNLVVAGLEDSDSGPMTLLRVKERLSGRQKTLLDKLGYNNWRKLAR